MDYKYSVIIPVYNAEKTLRRCLDSLLKQVGTLRVQIIVINDGSSDKSGEICKEYALEHGNIVYLKQSNTGVSAARNAGLAVAAGEYITFVDSDDFVLDGYFSEMEQYTEDFLIFPVETICAKGVVRGSFGAELLHAATNRDVILGVLSARIAGPCNKRFSRSIIAESQIRFKEDLTIGEDFIFGLEYMLLCNSSAVCTDCLYCVDETGTNSITRAAKYDLSQFLRIYEHAFRIADLCEWDVTDKGLLMQQLDYLYCRTSFAATKHCLNAREKASMKAKKLVHSFCVHRCTNIEPLNFKHRLMQLCLKYKVLPVFFAIAWGHRLLSLRH